jgi:hypothetical protein
VLELEDRGLRALIDGRLLFEVQDHSDKMLTVGGVALIVDTGSISAKEVRVSPH